MTSMLVCGFVTAVPAAATIEIARRRMRLRSGAVRVWLLVAGTFSGLAVTKADTSLGRSVVFFWTCVAGFAVEYLLIKNLAPESLVDGARWFERHKLLPFALVIPAIVFVAVAFTIRG